MITSRLIQLARVALLVSGVSFAVGGCSEPLSIKEVAVPDPVLEARLVMSDSAPAVGATVDVFAQITALTPEVIGSYTARIRYDSTALRYQQELAIADDALRATNATSGLLRFAGASPHGLPSGRLAGYRFVVLRRNAILTLQLVVDEMHTVSRTDAAKDLRWMPHRVEVAP